MAREQALAAWLREPEGPSVRPQLQSVADEAERRGFRGEVPRLQSLLGSPRAPRCIGLGALPIKR